MDVMALCIYKLSGTEREVWNSHNTCLIVEGILNLRYFIQLVFCLEGKIVGLASKMSFHYCSVLNKK